MGGKKAANKLKKSEEASQPEPENKPRAAAVPASWEDELTPEQKEFEEKKKKERQKKADEAVEAQKRDNERRQWYESQRQKEDRAKERETKKWEQSVRVAKVRALKEGVVEAEDGGETWWAQLPDNTWKEVTGQFYCVHCSKQLNEGTLEAHLNSDGHQKKLAWIGVAPDPGPQGPPLRPTQALACPPCWPTPRPGAALEDWQERTQEGHIRCIPCGKVIDESHLAKEDHVNRLERWREMQRVQRCGYPEPELPYVAYVPCEESNPNGERWLKCLLCSKWINDDVSHSGTAEAPHGSKEHQKNLRNYTPGDPWYEEHVTRERLRWHPPQRGQPSQPAPAGQPASAAQGDLPAGWEAARDPTGKMYYFNRNLGKTQWERPAPAEVPAPAPPQPRGPPAPPVLPAGWTEHKDHSGNTYYHNAQRGESTWQLPALSEENVEV